jgi:hypothetical protein
MDANPAIRDAMCAWRVELRRNERVRWKDEAVILGSR